MGRPKKEIDTSPAEVSKAVEEEVIINPHKIAPLTSGFGRADLDAMRDKINEIIEHI